MEYLAILMRSLCWERLKQGQTEHKRIWKGTKPNERFFLPSSPPCIGLPAAVEGVGAFEKGGSICRRSWQCGRGFGHNVGYVPPQWQLCHLVRAIEGNLPGTSQGLKWLENGSEPPCQTFSRMLFVRERTWRVLMADGEAAKPEAREKPGGRLVDHPLHFWLLPMVNKTKLVRMRMRMIVVCLPVVSRAKLMRGRGAEVKSGLHWMTSKAGGARAGTTGSWW